MFTEGIFLKKLEYGPLQGGTDHRPQGRRNTALWQMPGLQSLILLLKVLLFTCCRIYNLNMKNEVKLNEKQRKQ